MSALADARSVAEFLRYTPGLGKTQIGEYISKGPHDLYPFHKEVLHEYVKLFDFSGANSSFDKALRMFLGHFRLPGEAQCIDRIMEAFAGHLFTHLGVGKPFASADAAFILAFSTILLNTDLHNPGIPLNKKMTKLQFVRNNRGINDQKDLPAEYLEGLYDEIKGRQIQVDIGVADTTQYIVDYTDTATWNKLIRQGSTDQAPAIFTPTLAARKSVSSDMLGTGDSSGSFRFMSAYPTSSLQDRDMFLMMSKPLLETLVVLWEATADDHVVYRVFQGLWDYAQLLSIRSRDAMARSRATTAPNTARAMSRRNALAYKSNYIQWKTDTGHDLTELISLDFDQLVTGNSGGKSFVERERSANWTEAALVKGELLVKIVFRLVALCPQALTQDAWVAVVDLLVWSRSRGALPKELSLLTDSFGDSVDTVSKNKATPLPQPSLYSRTSHLSAYGVPASSLPGGTNKARPSVPNESQKRLSSVPRAGGSWLSSLFFQDAETSDDSVNLSVQQLDLQSESLLESTALYNNANSCKFVSLTGEALRSDDELLSLSLTAAQTGKLFASHSDDAVADGAVLNVLVSALLESMDRTLNALMTSSSSSSARLTGASLKGEVSPPTSGAESYFPDHLLSSSSKGRATAASDLDFVVMLEWLYLLVSSSTARLTSYWPQMHAFFRTIFEDKLDQLSEQHPYVLERCVVVILRSTVELIGIPTVRAPHTPTSLQSGILLPQSSSSSSSALSAESVWMSLRLMRGMSGDLIMNLSGRIGFGVLSMITATHKTNTPLNLEQWYMIFSLLSAATSGPEGRAFVWSAICFLIEQSMVGDINFTPCRHLVLRYLHGVFPGELALHEKEGHQHAAQHNQWMLPSMGHLLHMTLMVLAGLLRASSLPSRLLSAAATGSSALTSPAASSTFRTPLKDAPAKSRSAEADQVSPGGDCVSFPMPPPFLFTPMKTTDMGSSPRTDQRGDVASAAKTQTQAQMQSVRCIRLGKAEDVEVVWLESCKIFSELTNSLSSNTSKQAVDCLRMVLCSGRFAHLTDAIWLKCLNELISRLPLHYLTAAGKLGSSHSVDGAHGVDSVDICHRCCNVVFDVILENVKQMRENVEFQSIWIRFISTLATIVGSTNKNALQLSGQQPFFHDEAMGMLEALLRLLNTPAMVLVSDFTPTTPVQIAQASVPTVTSSESKEKQASAVPVVAAAPTGYFGVFNWFGTAATPQVAASTTKASVNNTASTEPIGVRSPPPAAASQQQQSTSSPQMVYDMDSPQPHDGALIASSWKTIVSVYPVFAVAMRQKNPKLVASILLYLECAERHLRKKPANPSGSGKTWTMGSSSDMKLTLDSIGIIPRVIKKLFAVISHKEQEDATSSYKVYVQFLEIYGEDMRDLLDQTRTSKVSIRESPEGEVFVSGAREELVSSYEQMMKALEEGTAHRTTASTKMNATSSRSHAIFTVFLEQTVHAGAALIQNPDGSLDSPTQNKGDAEGAFFSGEEEVAVEAVALKKVAYTSHEVRKCKFRFVDLAGSERAKRTGAQGLQLKEGIDINKGLLALGNVISALGDDSKKGKSFVPYRDSKLTRILQDSLGGNSKTLMICCVSPACSNFSESVNALRYANRARNIKNKPVVNRDPTLVIIDELKVLLKVISSELLEMRVRKQYFESDRSVSMKVLENCANAITSTNGIQTTALSASTSAKTNGFDTSSAGGGHKAGSSNVSKKGSEALQAQLRKVNDDLLMMRSKLSDGDFEVQRLTAQLKLARQAASDNNESILFARSERDFYKMKWAEACPQEAHSLEALSDAAAAATSAHSEGGEGSPHRVTGALNEKQQAMGKFTEHLREIDSLKKQLADERSRTFTAGDNELTASGTISCEVKEFAVDEEFTSSIAALISQTREQLREESNRLRGMERGAGGGEESDEDLKRAEQSALMEMDVNDMEEERAFIRRQKILTTEVSELGQSIQLKEQLVSQLTRSQHQYVAMKTFYEQKLSALNSEMVEKQLVRDRLENELQNIEEEKHEVLAMKQDREKKLREDLKHKDEELKLLKKKQEDLHQLSQSQSRYMQQQAKLEADITAMKKQRVDLSKTLQSEKKNHLLDLGNKVKEIDKLKRELTKSANEIKKLGRDKEVAENKARDAVREGAVLKKKTQELMRTGGGDASLSTTRAAVRSLNKASRLSVSGAKRILSEEELRTKKWLDKRVVEISAREAAAESLKKQYEYQLELLSKKESLEHERQAALEKNESPDGSDEADERMDGEGSPSQYLLSSNEKEKLLEIEEQLARVNGMISQKTQQIDEIQKQMDSAGDVPGSEKTIEVLKRSAAGSLPASHELIRLLFDMLVYSSKTIHEKSQHIEQQRSHERRLHREIEENAQILESERRNRDMDLTRAANEYEQNLSSLFSNMASLTPALLASSSATTGPPLSPFKETSAASLDPTKLQLAISTEESKFLRSQLQRQSLKSSQMQSKLLDIEKMRTKLLKELEDKNIQIQFLEEERSLFKELADDFKNGLATLGKPGKLIVDSVKDLATHKRKSGVGLFSEYMHLSEFDEDEDGGGDDSESVLGEFDFLADEINRTGSIQSSYPGESNGKFKSDSNSAAAKMVVYDRLTNPSNFTGHMKNVFNKDIEEKRRKIKDSRNHEKFATLLSHRKDKDSLHINTSSSITVPSVSTNGTTSGGNSTTKNEALLSKKAVSHGSGSDSHKFFSSDFTEPAPSAQSFSLDSSDDGARTIQGGNASLSASLGGDDGGGNGQGALVPNVFSRLSTKFTGMHKHRNSLDEGQMQQSVFNVPPNGFSTTSATSLRSPSPFTSSASTDNPAALQLRAAAGSGVGRGLVSGSSTPKKSPMGAPRTVDESSSSSSAGGAFGGGGSPVTPYRDTVAS
eukprot:gene22368-28490_t